MALEGWLSKQAAVVAVPIVTVLFGILIGYLAQRSRFCSVGGFRDLFLFKHTRLVWGYLTLIIGALIGYIIFSLLIPSAFAGFPWVVKNGILSPIPGSPAGLSGIGYVVLTVISGLVVGLVGVFVGGCPLRQVTMTSEGNTKSLFFVIGMCIGAVVFAAFLSAWVVGLMKGAGL
ncbi:MAG: YeeE/YedE family protein [Methanoregulaceae archaeon]|nr:YeeE/YedE family protein [Methanoregulaceae archaeon]